MELNHQITVGDVEAHAMRLYTDHIRALAEGAVAREWRNITTEQRNSFRQLALAFLEECKAFLIQ